MKKLLFLLFILTLNSCVGCYGEPKFIVESVTSVEGTDMCDYQIQSKGILQFDIRDICGKYQAGDTLHLTK